MAKGHGTDEWDAAGVSKATLKSGVIVILGIWATPNVPIGVAGGIVCFLNWTCDMCGLYKGRFPGIYPVGT